MEIRKINNGTTEGTSADDLVLRSAAAPESPVAAPEVIDINALQDAHVAEVAGLLKQLEEARAHAAAIEARGNALLMAVERQRNVALADLARCEADLALLKAQLPPSHQA